MSVKRLVAPPCNAENYLAKCQRGYTVFGRLANVVHRSAPVGVADLASRSIYANLRVEEDSASLNTHGYRKLALRNV